MYDKLNKENIITKNKELIFELALLINKEIFDNNQISYKTFKSTEENILNRIKNINV